MKPSRRQTDAIVAPGWCDLRAGPRWGGSDPGLGDRRRPPEVRALYDEIDGTICGSRKGRIPADLRDPVQRRVNTLLLKELQ